MSTSKLLIFKAQWCNPCKALSTVMEGLNLPHEVIAVDIDEEPELAVKYGVRGIPTLVLVDESGVFVDRLTGSVTKDQILSRFGGSSNERT